MLAKWLIFGVAAVAAASAATAAPAGSRSGTPVRHPTQMIQDDPSTPRDQPIPRRTSPPPPPQVHGNLIMDPDVGTPGVRRALDYGIDTPAIRERPAFNTPSGASADGSAATRRRMMFDDEDMAM